MALKEEFEYLSYRCCYCYTLNPARKKRPAAPRLELSIRNQSPPQTGTDTSDSEKKSSSDSESEDLSSDKVTMIYGAESSQIPNGKEIDRSATPPKLEELVEEVSDDREESDIADSISTRRESDDDKIIEN